jgi:UDPglucose--hexose-1-phosphate uridylyltransferase
VRVVPNKYPALAPKPLDIFSGDFLHPVRAGFGIHEVIVHGPDHHRSFGQMTTEEVALVFSVYQERLRAAASRPELEGAVVIVNHGPEAGASIRHPHSQLFAIPVVPPLVARELQHFREYQDSRGSCLLCDLVESEQQSGERIVAETERLVAFCPYASRVPFEVYISPKGHPADFTLADPGFIEETADLSREVLSRLFKGLGDIPYNIYLHTRPFHSSEPYHWHLVILPKTSIIAGFEYATGIIINVVEPEAAALFLREQGGSLSRGTSG